MNTLLVTYLLSAFTLVAQVQGTNPMEGLREGYDAEWGHVSRQLPALAEATPAEKFAWRPATGVRSTDEVYRHIGLANFSLLSYTGPALPEDLKSTYRADIIRLLRRLLEGVKAGLSSAALQRRVKISGKEVNADGMYPRILVHGNEHMEQLIAERMSGITPPWSEATVAR
jgi:hypothetical protein